MGLTLILGAGLLALWLVLSGHYTALLITFGVLSVCLVVWVATRMKLTDSEGVWVHLFPGLLGYWVWLTKEIFLSNVQVARIVLSPSLPISPGLIHYRASQETDLGLVLFGNSVTLTPGTITTDVTGNDLRIHALEWRFVDGVETGEMDARVRALEGGPGGVFEASRARIVELDELHGVRKAVAVDKAEADSARTGAEGEIDVDGAGAETEVPPDEGED